MKLTNPREDKTITTPIVKEPNRNIKKVKPGEPINRIKEDRRITTPIVKKPNRNIKKVKPNPVNKMVKAFNSPGGTYNMKNPFKF
jgi:hypothetical protein